MKRLFLMTLVLAATINMSAFDKDGLYYSITSLSELTVELVAPTNSSYVGDVTVPKTVEYMSRTFNVTSISETAFKGCNVNKLTITDGIKKIDKLIFGKVKSFILEDSDEPLVIEDADEDYSCGLSLQNDNGMSVYIGRDIKNDDWYALFESDYDAQSGASSVEFGPKVTTIAGCLFRRCTTLTTAIIPDNVKTIGRYAFEETSLTDVKALGVTTLEYSAFEDCAQLKRVEFSDALTEIPYWTFYGCEALEEFVIPTNSHSLTSIGNRAFEGCKALKEFVFPANSYKLVSIGERAFYGCSALKSVVIPEGVILIGSYAFANCKGLETVKIPNSVFSLEYAHKDFEMDKDVYEPQGVFSGCSALKTIIVGHQVPIKMLESTFNVSTYLSATLKVPTGSKEKYQSAKNWSNFSSIEEDATINDEICTAVISRECNLHEDFDKYEFDSNYSGTVTTKITGSINEYIRHDTGEYDDEIMQKYITAPRGGQITISLNPSENQKLTSLTVNGEDVTPSVVRNVYTMDFTDNMEMTIIPTSEYYPYKKIETDKATFKEQDDGGFAITNIAENVTKAEIPEIIVDEFDAEYAVTAIENSAFENNTKLVSISIPASVTYIADRAFAGCTSLEEIYVYKEEPIELTAQSQLSNSLQIGFTADATEAGTSGLPVFEGVNKETCILYVPKGCAEKYRDASGWNEFSNIVEFDITAVEEISGTVAEAKAISSYSIDGKRFSQPQKGLNILRMSDGTTRKIVR